MLRRLTRPALHGGPETNLHAPPRPGRQPSLHLQVNALQALCRQVFGFRLAMIALASPFAIYGARPGLPRWLVCGAVVVTFMASYVLFRDWERFGPLLLRYRTLLVADMLLSGLLLVTATTESPLAYVSVCGPLLAGLAYGWRSAAGFALVQSFILVAAYAAEPGHPDGSTGVLLLPGFCVIAGAIGVSLRNLMLRFGVAGEALTEARSRLAVRDAVENERARLARDMHDSLAKTLHGVALAADGLAESADRLDPFEVRQQAELVSRSARRAAAESRELLTDLRQEAGLGATTDIAGELAARVRDVARRTKMETSYRTYGAMPLPPVPQALARQLTAIAAEAMENAHRHAECTRLTVTASVTRQNLRISVIDDGAGLPTDLTLDEARKAGHFGLVGMIERAAGIGARIRIGRGRAVRGTEVRVDLPLAAFAPSPGPVGDGTGVTAPAGVASQAAGR
ncbi:sensor histidine kinase [Streptomyces sp. TR06-5]|uniref:sensor histidine kinase n=1 Tax=unclassified Streptomyces TaxID=2593676 RepID=UPI00399F8490